MVDGHISGDRRCPYYRVACGWRLNEVMLRSHAGAWERVGSANKKRSHRACSPYERFDLVTSPAYSWGRAMCPLKNSPSSRQSQRRSASKRL